MPSQSRLLHDNWLLSPVAPPAHVAPLFSSAIPATVPGCVHLDLLGSKLIPNPYLGTNELAVDWVGVTTWRYATEFEWQPDDAERIDLVFEGLDTVATIELNGEVIGTTFNMHRVHRFDVTQRVRSGVNALSVTFGSAWEYGEAERRRLGDRPANYPGPYGFLRKMACNFGWDWGPTLVTAGIWRPVFLQSWSTARLAAVRPSVTVEGDRGLVELRAEILRVSESTDPLILEASIGGITRRTAVAPDEGATVVTLEVPSPDLWWPHGMGAQPLYDLLVELKAGDEAETTLDRWSHRVGFRSVRLDTSPDEVGSAFTFIINNVPIFVTGANWIPDDCFLPRVTPERYRARIAQARDANINMLRVWGGGIYEDDAFYQACNELGILVWQDFLFACACYPEEEPLWTEIEAEARDAITRLMPNPSLVLWNGNNENIWGYFDWGWKSRVSDTTWGLGYYLDLLPRLVAELDPARAYWAGSPYSGSMDIHPNDDNHGCKHIWDVWNTDPYDKYREYVPRFLSEFGYQAPPTWATLTQSIREEPLSIDSPGLLHHQKATNGNAKLAFGLRGHLPESATIDDWHYLTQLNQARAIRFGVEHFRSHRPTCMGTIVWQLNDCWPVTSWAAIDGFGRKKPLWYTLREVYAQHLVTIQPRGEGLSLIALNENALYWRVPMTIKRMNLKGEVLAFQEERRLLCDRLSCAVLPIPQEIATPGNPREEFILAEAGGLRAFWFFAEDVEINYPAADYDIHVVEGTGDWEVTVKAKSFLRDVCLFVDRIHPDAEIDDMLITLLPGESRCFRLKTPVRIDASVASIPSVFRCVNQVTRTSTQKPILSRTGSF
jgi:beta-mannosidase